MACTGVRSARRHFCSLRCWAHLSLISLSRPRPAFAHFGFSFIWGTQWNPVTAHYGALPFIVGTLETTVIAMVLAIAFGLGAAIALAHLLPARLRVVLGTAIELLAAIPSVVYGLWGLLVLAPWAAAVVEPAIGAVFGHSGPASGPELGLGLLLAGLVLFVMVLPTMVTISGTSSPRSRSNNRGRTRARCDPLAGAAPRRGALREGGPSWRRHPLDGPGARRNDCGDDGHRQYASDRALTVRAGLDDGVGHRQPVHRGDRTVPPRCARCGRRVAAWDVGARQLCGSTARPFHRPLPQRDRARMSVMTLDPILTRRAEVQHIAEKTLGRRQLASRVALIVCVVCVVVALVPLVAIVGYTVDASLAAWSADFFTHLPTPAGISGGRIQNSIIGSLMIEHGRHRGRTTRGHADWSLSRRVRRAHRRRDSGQRPM